MERIAGDVERELGRFGPAAGMTRIVAAWPAAAGPTNARRAWPARIGRDGTLHVATSDSTWAFELGQLAPQLLERLRAALGDEAPRALRFAPGRLPEAAEAEEPGTERAAPEPSPEERELAAALAAGIGDEDLRKLVARAAAASLSRGKSSRSVW